MGKFQYRESDETTVRDHAERRGMFDSPIKEGVAIANLKEGQHRIRILPRTWEGDPKHWAYPVWRHHGVGPDNAAYLCPDKHGKGRCPICEERTKLDREGDEERARELRPNQSFLVWIIDRAHEEDGPKVFFMPAKKLESPICGMSRDLDTGEVLKIDHPDKGHDVSFRKQGTGLKTDWTEVQIHRKQTYLAQDEKEQEEWLEHISKNPLPEILRFYDADYLDKVFSGKVSSGDEDRDAPVRRTRNDDEPPPRSRASSEDTRSRERSRGDDEPPPRSRASSETPKDDDLDRPRERAREESREPRERPSESSRGRESSERGSRGDDEPPPRRSVREEAPEGLPARRRE